MIPWWATSFDHGESQAAAEAIDARRLSQGPLTRQFEEALADYLEVPHVIAVTSGTTALHLALLAHGIGPGDEVIVPNRTWIASAHAILHAGATPVFADTVPNLPIMDVADAARRVTERTKAIMPVHMNGRVVDMDAINRLCDQHGLVVIEDAAQALGSRDQFGRKAGALGEAGCFSLSVTKVMSTGQGGFIATCSSDLAQRMRNLRTHGVEDTVEPGTWQIPGHNFRFTDVLASIGIVQMSLLDDRLVRLESIQQHYAQGLAGLEFVRLIPMRAGEIGPYVEVLARDRLGLQHFLQERGVETRQFYPDLDTAPYWPSGIGLENSRLFGREGLYLPSGPSITDQQVDTVVCLVQEYEKALTSPLTQQRPSDDSLTTQEEY
ncbi:MAG: DegT/DnrJ/EryC1/StrS family aminotransferase [Chloroflexi bacterium]|nr:DegT/DnrJ/EryC1/StrS family aminotransferase [Chloroflexota bacterium]